MSKRAFTMIELIFVIVVLGILASVAVAKFFSVGALAHEQVLEGFVKSLNDHVGVELWSESLASGKEGNISSFESITKYISIPKEFDEDDINMSKCDDDTEYKLIAQAHLNDVEYNLTCKDGNSDSAPYFKFVRDDGKVLVTRE